MNGILIPWPMVTLGVVAVALYGLRRLNRSYAFNRFGMGAIGTMSFSLGIAAFSFVFATSLPKASLAFAAPESAIAEKSEKSEPPAESADALPAKSASAAAQAELESPISGVKIDLEKRPAWVESAHQLEGDVQTVAVSSGPWATQSECDRALNDKLLKATDDYIREYLHNDSAPEFLHYDLAYIKKYLVREKGVYNEMMTVSFGQMKQSHALLKFDGAFRRELEASWQKVKATSRLGQTGLAFGGLLALLGTVFGYFKLDHATRGFYAGRLQMGMAAVILTLVAAGIALAVLISWV